MSQFWTRSRVQKAGEPCLKSAESRVSDCDSNPVIEPVREPTSGAQAREEEDFSKLWDCWPEAERPQKRAYAEHLFKRLAPDDRCKAVKAASGFRAVRARQGVFAPMILYLRDRQFLEFEDGPEIDGEGYFVIRSDREEWNAWLDHCRSQYSDKILASTQKRGFILTRTRWPAEKAPTGQSQPPDDAAKPPMKHRNAPRNFRLDNARRQGRPRDSR